MVLVREVYVGDGGEEVGDIWGIFEEEFSQNSRRGGGVVLRRCYESQVTASWRVHKHRQTVALDNGHNAGKARRGLLSSSMRSSMDVIDYHSHYLLAANIEARLLCLRREGLARRLDLRPSVLRETPGWQ